MRCGFPLAGVPRADGHDGGDPRRDGGEQQVLPLRPLPLRPGGGEKGHESRSRTRERQSPCNLVLGQFPDVLLFDLSLKKKNLAEMACFGGASAVGAQGVPGPPAHQRQEGLGDPTLHQVG